MQFPPESNFSSEIIMRLALLRNLQLCAIAQYTTCRISYTKNLKQLQFGGWI
jgi:hypothetical protein